MPEDVLVRIEKLVEEGGKLTPLGGYEFSGYNARLQNKYLAWRKACLESLEAVGPIGLSYKNKIAADANGGFFYMHSAHLIFVNIKELFEKLKASPELAAEAVQVRAAPAQAAPVESQSQATGATRTIKPPVKSAAAAAQQPQASVAPNKAFVIGELNDSLRQQLSAFLEEVGVAEVAVDRIHGEMIALDGVADEPGAKFAFFIFNSDYATYAMFELGHFVGKLGKNHVMVLHMTDVDVPKNIPGVVVKPIVVKLEEASLSIIKELRTAGYALSI